MNVGPSGEGSKGSPSNSPPPSVAAPAAELSKYENEGLVGRDETDMKVPAKTTFAQKDAVLEPTKQSPPKGKKKRTWKKPEVSLFVESVVSCRRLRQTFGSIMCSQRRNSSFCIVLIWR